MHVKDRNPGYGDSDVMSPMKVLNGLAGPKCDDDDVLYFDLAGGHVELEPTEDQVL